MIYTAQIELTSNREMKPEVWQKLVEGIIFLIGTRYCYSVRCSLLELGLPIDPELVKLIEDANE